MYTTMTTEVPKSILDAGLDAGLILAREIDGKMTVVQGIQRAKIQMQAGSKPRLTPIGGDLFRVDFFGTKPKVPKKKGAKRLALDAEVRSRKGCLQLRRSRATGTLVGLYRSAEGDMEVDPELPYTTVCEDHSTLVSHRTLADARANLGHPEGWCDACRGEPDESME